MYWRCNYCWICNQRGFLVETFGCGACSNYVCTLHNAGADESPSPGANRSLLPWLSRYLQPAKVSTLISRAANMRLHSRALAFAVLLAGAILPIALDAQVVPAIKGGGSQINVYGTYTLVKTDFNSTLDYPPSATLPPAAPMMPMAGTRPFPWGLIFAWDGLCLVSPRSEHASPGARGRSGNKEPLCSGPRSTTSTASFALTATL